MYKIIVICHVARPSIINVMQDEIYKDKYIVTSLNEIDLTIDEIKEKYPDAEVEIFGPDDIVSKLKYYEN